MALESVAQSLIKNAAIQERIDALIVDALRREFPAIDGPHFQTDHHWKHLLMCGSLFAGVHNEDCAKAALRITEQCLHSATTFEEERQAAAVLLHSMANTPAIALAKQRKLIPEGVFESLPFPLKQDLARRSLEDIVILVGGAVLPVNHFQRAFWDATRSNRWISVSAPTSAGKSFILKAWVGDYVQRFPACNIAYLVPTRALIQEVQRDFEQHFSRHQGSGIKVHVLPKVANSELAATNIFVFTQERLHLLLNSMPSDFVFSVLIVDEAQKVGDGGRGVLLLQVIDETVRREPDLAVVFASPQTENPEYLLKDAAGSRGRAVAQSAVTVIQNLLWVSQRKGDTKTWDVIYRDGEKALPLGSIALPGRPAPESKRLSFVAYAMRCTSGGNIVYVNGAAEAEKIADQLYALAPDPTSIHPRISSLIDLIQKTIHSKFSLARTLKRGIAYHYGNMPLLVRTEIERLFGDNIISFLVCTSTLMEGVNLPCKTIFARGPRKGKGSKMSSQDFWNLAGRAGRWGKEFHGHIVCIDPSDENLWEGAAPTRRAKSKIQSIVERVLISPDDFVAYVSSGFSENLRKEHPEYNQVFNYLASVLLRDATIRSPWSMQLVSPETMEIVRSTVRLAMRGTKIPEPLIRKHPGILPVDMEKLLAHFERSSASLGNFVPSEPESDDAVAGYERILSLINQNLNAQFGVPKRIKSLAILIVQWMKGYPLKDLIAGRVKYSARHNPGASLQEIIRNVMSDVEQFARFSAPRFLSCYVDLLRLCSEAHQDHNTLSAIPSVDLYLEFGVSTQTQLSLMGIGFSRTTALMISERIASDKLLPEEVVNYLVRARDWETWDIPSLIKAEIQQFVLRNERK